MIRVLIAEDSPVVQRVLVSLLDKEKDIEIVGVVSDGAEAVEMCRKKRPDLVTMDIFMPKMDGVEATRRIMDENPTRIVIISSMVNSTDLKTTFEAMRSGAVEVVEKPHGALSGNYAQVRDTLVRIIKQMMKARPENRFSWVPGGSLAVASPTVPRAPTKPPKVGFSELPVVTSIPKEFIPAIVCIGGSTGAPAVLFDVLSNLPADYPVPIVVAQHIASGFVAGMVEWLDASIDLKVSVAKTRDFPSPGTVLVAPDHCHLWLQLRGGIKLVPAVETDIYTPSINVFFESAAKAYGARGMGIILSGMGRDGSEGLLKMRKLGAMTIAQNETSSVIYGMPREAVRGGAVVEEMNPVEMIDLLMGLMKSFTMGKPRKS